MLMIFLMAILSLDLIRYSSQNRNSGTPLPDQRTGYGLHRFSDTVSSNLTLKHTTTTVAPAHNAKIRRKILVRKRKSRLNDTTSGASTALLSKKKPTPKSDMQVMQFYAQPMPTFDLSYHPPIYENYNPLVNGILNMNDQSLFTTPSYGTLPTMEPMPFKLPPQEQLFQPMASNWNVPNSERVQRIPIYDPFNILKRKQLPRIRAKPVVAKFIPAVRPITVTTMPPISVTHVYKYEETNSGLNMPFDDDPFVENFPALSVALNQHHHDHGSLRGYMTPPKLNQPIYYNMPVVDLPTLSPVLQNEYGILHKFNEAIKQQNTSPKAEEPVEYEDDKETQEEKNYSDDDVKKAIEYIQHLKKTEKPNRGSKKFNTDKSEGRRNKKGKKNHDDEESLEEDEEATQGSKKRTKKPKDFSMEDDDNFRIKSFEELDEEESHKKTVKSRKPVKNSKKPEIDQIKYQESQIVPRKPVKNDSKKSEIDQIKYQESQIVPRKPVKNDNKKSEIDQIKYQESQIVSRKPVKNDNKKTEIDQIKYQESQIVPTLDHEDYEAPPDFSQNTVVGGEGNEERVEFQMHGLQGPESYKFGYDTGKGESRQFRYEERDPDGRVKGHFGYVDNNGKLQVFNYEADPEHGYHLEQAHD